MLSMDPTQGPLRAFLFREGKMNQFNSDWARMTGLAGGTAATMLFLAITLFFIVQ